MSTTHRLQTFMNKFPDRTCADICWPNPPLTRTAHKHHRLKPSPANVFKSEPKRKIRQNMAVSRSKVYL